MKKFLTHEERVAMFNDIKNNVCNGKKRNITTVLSYYGAAKTNSKLLQDAGIIIQNGKRGEYTWNENKTIEDAINACYSKGGRNNGIKAMNDYHNQNKQRLIEIHEMCTRIVKSLNI